jgi:hypothetical protein
VIDNSEITPAESKRSIKLLADYHKVIEWFPKENSTFSESMEALKAKLTVEHKRHEKAYMKSVRKGNPS